jgi:undecaprenyl diphosphate synthase
MDGNGRWGLKKKKSRNLGHKEGLKAVEKIIKQSIKKNIKYLTLFAFSTENWKRPKKEINFLFNLLEEFLINKTKELNKNGIKLKIIGKKKNFSKKLKKLLKYSEFLTKQNNKLQLILAIDYGSRNEITNSIKLLKKINIPISERNVTNNLYTSGVPDPEILIRTGNTKRLSNFLLWQLSYTEIFFIKKLWPDFTVLDFNRIINNFKNLKRNFGKI